MAGNVAQAPIDRPAFHLEWAFGSVDRNHVVAASHELVMRSSRDRAPARVVKPQLVARRADERRIGVVVDDDREVLAAMAARGWPVFHADWEQRAVDEDAALREAQESEGRT